MNYKFLLPAITMIAASVQAQNFTKISTGPFVTTNGDSRSVNWVDVNNDGHPDCMITNGPNGGQNNMLYINNGAGDFNPVSGSPIVMDGQPSDGATWADIDNDGDLDCYVANWYNTSNLLYINNGSVVFVVNSGTPTISGGYCETASWGDYDKDGKVDLYVTNSAGANKNLLFHNDGNNIFTKVTTGDMVNDISDSRSVNWTDIDNDGDPDLFITNESNQNEAMYRNEGTGFTKVVIGAIVNGLSNTMSSSWGDYDNDGDLDVFLANDGSMNALYRNEGNFSFTKMASDTISKTMGNSFSSAWSDIDNDGDLDLYVTNSFGSSLHKNFMYLNNGNGTFSRMSAGDQVNDLDWSYGCAFGDFNNDGFEDLAVATCRYQGADRPDLLYRNVPNNNKWITIKLNGTSTNRSAIGTKVRIKAMINGIPTWQMREISAQSGYCSQNDMRAHFGLGNASQIDSIRIEWLSGLKETYVNIGVNQFLNYTEGQSLGIDESSSATGFEIFPNPGQGVISVTANQSKFHPGDRIRIMNASGVIVYEEKIEKTTSCIELHKQLASGHYIINIITGKGVLSKKFTRL